VSICHWPCRIDQPPQRLTHGLKRHSFIIDVSGNIIDGARQNEDAIPNVIELSSRYNKLIFGQLEVRRSLTGHPIPLAACLTTELSGPSPALTRCDGVSTPSTLDGW